MPVSLIGTFAAMQLFGFSLNNLSLFGLVLAIGIVVDDAIVVVEDDRASHRARAEPRDAARKAMDEVSGAVVAVALVLARGVHPDGLHDRHHRAVLPAVRADHRRLDRDLRAQFAHAFARARRDPAASRTARRRTGCRACIDGLLGWFFRGFNRVFGWSIERLRPHGRAPHAARRLVLLVYAGLLALTVLGFKVVPAASSPRRIAATRRRFCQLPDAASLDRTQEVVDKMAKIARETPGVLDTMEIAGMNLFGGNQSNTGAVFLPFKEFAERKGAGRADAARSSRS